MLDNYQNPITTQEDIKNLHKVLVQTVIDYIKNSGVIIDDVMTYTIEEYEPKMYRVTYEDGTDDYFYYPDDITARDEHCDDDKVIEIAEVDAHIETFPTINIIFS